MNLISNYSSKIHSQDFESSGLTFQNTAFYSLKIALKGYFSTYQSMKNQLSQHTSNPKNTIKHDETYYEHFLEAIVHFQHFFELIVKDILEKESPLLVVKANLQPVILHKLINEEEIHAEEYNKLYSIEFSEALKTLTELLNKGRIKNPDYLIFKDKKEILLTLNNFRNRIWHRGRFALKYYSLDEFMGKYILPLVLDVVNLNEYINYRNIWKGTLSNKLDIDIINEIIKEFKVSTPDYSKVALLKEIGRIEISPSNLSFKSLDHISTMTTIEESLNMVSDILKCPVCGNKSLLNCYEYESHLEELGDEYSQNFSMFTVEEFIEDRVECFLCKFEVKKFVKNPEEYGYNKEFRFWNI